VLKKKHSKTSDETRYHGTLLGTPADPRVVPVEGGDVTSVKEWADKLRKRQRSRSSSRDRSRAQSSDLSSLGEDEMEGIDFEQGS
jgi:transcription initiation factor TFIID subunit 3